MTDTTAPQTDAASTPAIEITRTFDAPRELVFAAWTQPAGFASWFGGAAMTVPLESVEMDVRPGGAWRATMLLEGGNEINWHGVYREVVEPERLVLTLSDRPGDEFELVTVVLTEVDGRTEMAFSQHGDHMDAAGYAQAKAGWETFFDTMAADLAA